MFLPGSGIFGGIGKSLGKLFKFHEGGIVPGHGSGDVPALLQPGEMVIPRRIARMMQADGRGGTQQIMHVTQNIHGDVNSEADEQRMLDSLAHVTRDRLVYAW